MLLKLKCAVRYYEDGKVNGKQDISFEEQKKGLKPAIPCTIKDKNGDWLWCPEIDTETGNIINWENGTEASIYYKVCDECEISCISEGKEICTNDGFFYCPDFLCPKEEGYGDYIIMNITSTGHIEDWNEKEFEKWMEDQMT